MSIIKAFQGIRYNPENGEELSNLIAPPYDVISEEERARLKKRSAHNVVHLILGEEKPNDSASNNRYTRAGAMWQEWMDERVLVRDPSPAIYRYNMSFHLKTPEGILNMERPGFVALLKLHEYSDGKVLPHERTLAGPKQDRFQLILHTRAQLSQIFMLYPDPKGMVDDALGAAPAEGALSCEDDLGVTHSMWPIREPKTIRAVIEHLEKQPIYIADGHHRYETSLAVRRHLLESSPLFAQGCDYVMAYFTPVENPGLTVFPYHRLIHNLPKKRLSGLVKKLEELFVVERALVSPLTPGAPRREFMTSLQDRGKGGTVFGMVDGGTGHAYYLTLRQGSHLFRSCEAEADVALCGLDVVVLEDLVMIGKLSIKHKDLLNEKHVSYQTDYDRILDQVQVPPNQLAFMMNPTPVSQVIRIADLKGIMPEKSTYFFPKLATGLVMNSLD